MLLRLKGSQYLNLLDRYYVLYVLVFMCSDS